MPKKDALTKRKSRVGNKVSHSKRRTKRKWELNLQLKKVTIDGVTKRIRISTRTLKTLTKKGIKAVLKKDK